MGKEVWSCRSGILLHDHTCSPSQAPCSSLLPFLESVGIQINVLSLRIGVAGGGRHAECHPQTSSGLTSLLSLPRTC